MAVYTTTFNEYTDDAQLSDWTAKWDSSGTEWLKRSGTSEYDNAYLEYSGSSYGKYALSWDDAGAAVEDVDITVVFKPTYDPVNGNSTQMIIARGGGTGASPTGYIVTLRNGYYRIAKYYNTIMQNLDTNPAVQTPTLDTAKWYALRFQISGTAIKARYWEVGDSEPGTWDLEGVDDDYSSGWCGVGADNAVDIYFDAVWIATDGDDPFAVSTPEMSPVGGPVDLNDTVSISCATPGATIYYTTDGTTPTTGSTVYSAPITITDDVTIKAFATKAGLTDSGVASEAYVVNLLMSVSGNIPEIVLTAEFNEERISMSGNLPLPVLTTSFDERLSVSGKLPLPVLTTRFGSQADKMKVPTPELQCSVSRNETASMSGKLPVPVLTTRFASRAEAMKLPVPQLTASVNRNETGEMSGKVPVPVLQAVIDFNHITASGKLPDIRLQALVDIMAMCSMSGVMPPPVLQAVCELVVVCSMSGLVPVPVLTATAERRGISADMVVPVPVMQPIATGDIGGTGSSMSEHRRFDGSLLRYERWPS